MAEARRMRSEILNRTPRSYRGGIKGNEGRGYRQPSGGIASTVSGGAPSVGKGDDDGSERLPVIITPIAAGFPAAVVVPMDLRLRTRTLIGCSPAPEL